LPSTQKIQELIQGISMFRFSGIFNPWSECSESERDPEGHLARRERLTKHLDCPNPKILLIGEAAGYQGCRFSGIPFTSERLLLEGQIPRMPALNERITSRPRPWSEPSATIVWKALHELKIAEHTVLFNAVPWHPEGKKGPLSNRTPNSAEKAAGQPHLIFFLTLFPQIPVAALGAIASASLGRMGITHTQLRHPAYGGATKFREGLSRLVKAGSA